jgi:hypothetical protein
MDEALTHAAIAIALAEMNGTVSWREKLMLAGYRIVEEPWTHHRFTSGFPRAGVTRTVGRS